MSTLRNRAVESLRAEDERVCYDAPAIGFMGPSFTRMSGDGLINGLMRRLIIRQADKEITGMAAFVVARTRFIDDFLKAQMGKGIKQVIILGAGFDSRAYRFYELLEGAKIFEVDHPDTQILKMLTVRRTLGPFPKNLTYVHADLDREKLEVNLPKNGYDKNLKTLFIWEGVTMYLTLEAVDKTLAFIKSNSGKGSIVIFDYFFESALDKSLLSKEAEMVRKSCARVGEPLRFGLKEGSVEEFLASRGFDLMQNMTAQSLQDAYFKGKGPQRKVFPLAAIACAQVKQQ
jgi:methyltransferase (TIGR00027 family)